MFLLRALPLSLAILWRFMIAAPFLVVLYMALVIGSFALSYVALMIFAPLAIVTGIVGIALAFIVAVHPYLIGTKIGLQVLDIKTGDPAHFKNAMLYGLIEAIAGFIVAMVILAVGLLITTGGLDPRALMSVNPSNDPTAAIGSALTSDAGLIAMAIVIGGLMLRAALLPALAGAAAGRDPRSSLHTPLSGFGSNFVPMTVFLILVGGIGALLLPLFGMVSGLGLAQLLTNDLTAAIYQYTSDSGEEITYSVGSIAMIAGAVVASVWLLCLQCAAAALSYEARIAQAETRKIQIREDNKADPDEIRDLLRSRMPKMDG